MIFFQWLTNFITVRIPYCTLHSLSQGPQNLNFLTFMACPFLHQIHVSRSQPAEVRPIASRLFWGKAPVSAWLCLRVFPALPDSWSLCISRVRAERGQTLTRCYGDHHCFLNAWFRKWFGHSFDICPRVSLMPHCPPLVSQIPVAGLDSHLPVSLADQTSQAGLWIWLQKKVELP